MIQTCQRARAVLFLFLIALFVTACGGEERPTPETPGDPAALVNTIADRAYEFTLKTAPEAAYFSGVELERHDGMRDNSPETQKAVDGVIDELLADLENIDAAALAGRAEWVTYALLHQHLSSTVATRVCREELWNVDQMGGFQLGYSQVAQLQPTGTAEYREQSLARWSKFAGFVDNEIALLQQGIELGYTAPKPAARRVIAQIDGLLSLVVEESPFFSPAVRDGDERFATDTRDIVTKQINPALQRYRDFLEDVYLEKARDDLSVTANPNGRECYEAMLRAYTTVDRSGAEIYELGQQTVADNTAIVIELGRETYGVDSFDAVIAAAKADAADKFESQEELLEFARRAVARAEQEMPKWVQTMPDRQVSVVPFPPEQEGTGRSAHYRPGTEDRPGEYRIPLHEAEKQSRGMAEAIAFHETWPGHHLQVAASQSMQGLHPVTRLIWFSGPGEGWARYSESLAAEMGLYEYVTGRIFRTAWRARGMVVDPGLHLFGWSREQARDYMMASGNYTQSEAEDMVDRISVMPGQLTSYDTGGLEIFALREQAEEALGDAFDLLVFHDRVLEYGTIPLGYLRQHIESWLHEQQ